MKKIITLLIMLACVFANAQNTVPTIEWAKTLGSGLDDGDGSWDILPLEDGGYMVSGQQWEGDINTEVGQVDYWVARLDAGGAIIWQKTYGGSGSDQVKRIVKLPDGGYLLAGTSQSSDGDVAGHYGDDIFSDWWIVKIDENGVLIWDKNLGGTSNEYLFDAIATQDGGYILAGSAASNNGDVVGNHNFSGFATDGWVVKLDGAGNIEWQRCYGGLGVTTLTAIQPTPDGGYVFVGETEALGGDVPPTPHGLLDSWVIKTDNTGTIQWSKLYGGSGIDSFTSIKITENGNYITAGLTDSNDGDISFNHTAPGNWSLRDVWVAELDTTGNIVWEQTYGGTGNEAAYQIHLTADCGYAVGGFYLYNAFEGEPNRTDPLAPTLIPSDGFLMKIGQDGTLGWVKTMGGYQNDKIWNFALTPDGGFVTVGNTNSADGEATGNNSVYGYYELWPGYSEWFGTYDNWIIKLGPDCEVPQFTTDTSVDVCNGGDITLSVATTGQKVSWYDSADATVPVHTGASWTLANITANASYWVEVTNCRCVSARIQVTVTINPVPMVTAQAFSVCAGTPATLTAVSEGNTINWYTDQTDTAILFTGSAYTTPSLSSATSYWVEAVSPQGCVSERVEVAVTVNALPVVAVPASTAVCTGGSAVITVSSAGNTINWYSSATDATIIFTGTYFTTPQLSANISYWAAAVSPEGCTSARAEVAVTVNGIPVLTVSNPPAICAGNATAITASSAGNTINWYSSATDTTVLFTGTNFATPQLSANTSYWAEAVSPEGCTSARAEVTVTVNAQPVLTVQSTSVCEGSSATVTAVSAGNTINWYTSQTDTTLFFTGTAYTTPALSASTSYWVEAVSAEGCTSARSEVTVTVNPLPILSAGALNVSVCSGSGAVLSATTSAGNTILWFANEDDTQPIATGGDYTTVVLTETTTYWAAAYNPQTNCISAKTGFVITITNNTVPVAEFHYPESTYCFSADNPLPALAAGFTEGGTFSSVSGLSLDTVTGEIDLRNSQPGNYVIAYEVSDEESCILYGRFETQVIIEACDGIQRGISPNGDDYNQALDLTGIGVRQLAIFNRYGQEVYGASNYVKEWEGQDKSGNELPSGTYFYCISKNDGRQLTGWIYINREK
ncbi:gliding motility-associated C-terminal domain-containing protein [Flavobacterium sp. DGU11]|uniref:Gliding motility-associated C-terminal domain-containing protein n=1 Tax=Flavobacterium arundinis TaxID=3139143 RepID=A0ABU9HU03_9FLAO